MGTSWFTGGDVSLHWTSVEEWSRSIPLLLYALKSGMGSRLVDPLPLTARTWQMTWEVATNYWLVLASGVKAVDSPLIRHVGPIMHLFHEFILIHLQYVIVIDMHTTNQVPWAPEVPCSLQLCHERLGWGESDRPCPALPSPRCIQNKNTGKVWRIIPVLYSLDAAQAKLSSATSGTQGTNQRNYE